MSSKILSSSQPGKVPFWSAAFWTILAPAAFAVSGGGLDFAGIDISGQDFSKANYKGKDFTQGAFVIISKTGIYNVTHLTHISSDTFLAQSLPKGPTLPEVIYKDVVSTRPI